MTTGASIPVARRMVGGRRRYNAQRRRARDDRRAVIPALLLADDRPCVAAIRWGVTTSLARLFGVHHSTIARDLAAIKPTLVLPDPCCRIHADLDARLQPVRAGYARVLGYYPTLEQLKRLMRGGE